MDTLWAFIDESKNKSYVLVAIVVTSREMPSLRKSVQEQRLPGQRRIHFRHESAERKRQIARKFARLPFVFVTSLSRNPIEIDARRECISDLITRLHRVGVQRIVLERDSSIEVSDRKNIERTLRDLKASQIEYRHEDPHHEPILWVADAAAWVLAKGLEREYGFDHKRY